MAEGRGVKSHGWVGRVIVAISAVKRLEGGSKSEPEASVATEEEEGECIAKKEF